MESCAGLTFKEIRGWGGLAALRHGKIKQLRQVILTPCGVKTFLGYGSQRLEDHLPSWTGGEDVGLLGPENLEVDGQRGDDCEQPGQPGAG